MSKPAKTTSWSQEDIIDLKQALPEQLEFCSLSGASSDTFKLYSKKLIDHEDVVPLVEDLTERLKSELGIEVVEVSFGAGYCGTSSAVPQIYVKYNV